MGWVGDVWTQEQVEDCFEEMSLRDALETRIEAIHHIQDLVNAVVEDKE